MLAPQSKLPQPVLERIDYAEHGRIKFNTDFALFRTGDQKALDWRPEIHDSDGLVRYGSRSIV